jgi:hypothetical protein
MKCWDGTKHVWHFFSRGAVRQRECKKCPRREACFQSWVFVNARLAGSSWLSQSQKRNQLYGTKLAELDALAAKRAEVGRPGARVERRQHR